MSRSVGRSVWLAGILALIAGALALAVGPGASSAASTSTCADVSILFARGSGTVAGGSDEADAFFADVRAALGPDTTVTAGELGARPFAGHRYPAVGGVGNMVQAGIARVGRSPGGHYRASVDEGVAEAVARLDATTVRCADQRSVLGGYSQGAQVIGEALFGLDDATRDRVAFVALFGDPVLAANGGGLVPAACRGDQYGWVRGNIRCYHDGGILGPRRPYVPADLEGRVGSWCDKQDGICTGNPLLVGDDAHRQYPVDEIPDAAAEIARRLTGA